MTVAKIPIEINYTWFVIFGLVLISLAQEYFPATNPGKSIYVYWLIATLAAVLLFASLLLHELSHALVAQKNKLNITGITLFIFGGVAHLAREPQNAVTELKMAVAGPLCSLGLAAVFFLCGVGLNSISPHPILQSLVQYLFMLNLIIAVFNLIPGFPLDGGRIVRALIWKATKNIKAATRIASAAGQGVAYVLMALGLLFLLEGQFISGVWFIFIGFFLVEAAQTSYRQLVFNRTLSGVHVDDIMSRNVITVPPDLTLSRLVDDYFFRFRFNSFPVVEADRVIGIVTLHDVKDISKEEWPSQTVARVMTPLNPAFLVNRHFTAFSALHQLGENGLGRLLVMDENKLVGIVSQKDIARLFEIKEKLEK